MGLLGCAFVSALWQSCPTEAPGQRPDQYGGNVVVLGRAGVATPPGASGFNDPALVSSGSLPASAAYADDDGTPLSPGGSFTGYPPSLSAGPSRLNRSQPRL
jgi:hypothetical protein